MAIETKTIGEAQKKWGEVTPGRASEYVAQTVARAAKWESNTLAAVPVWHQSLQAANIQARMSTALRRAGAAKFGRKVREVGQTRFGSGVTAALADYAERFAPYLQIIQGLNLPSRGPRGDPRNYNRVNAVGDALYRARIAAVAVGT